MGPAQEIEYLHPVYRPSYGPGVALSSRYLKQSEATKGRSIRGQLNPVSAKEIEELQMRKHRRY
jgi:hypothetical protein